MAPPSLASRLLFHASPPPHVLDAHPELDAEFYDFIALALRAFVSPWWSKISRYDKHFLPQITNILVVVIRALDARAHALDHPQLLFHNIPLVLTQHYRDYRNAAAKTSTSYAAAGAADLPTLFAHLQPHIAISSSGSLDPEYYRQIVDHILKVCLPPEDYAPDSERIIVREIIVKILLNDIIPKLSQPWFIYKILLDLLGSPEDPIFTVVKPVTQQPSSSQPFSFHNLIVIVLSALQAFSGACLSLIHAYKQMITTIKLVQQSPPRSPQPPALIPPPLQPPLDALPPSSLVREHSSRSVPSIKSSESSYLPGGHAAFSTSTAQTLPTTGTATIQQISFNYIQPPIQLLSEIICAPERFASTLILTTLSIVASCMTVFLDKLLPHMLYAALSGKLVLNIMRTAKRTLFPNGYPGPPPIEPTAEEQAEVKAKLLSWKGRGAIAVLLPFILGSNTEESIDAALAPFSNADCNKRLIVYLLDCILLALFPELGGAPPPYSSS